MKTKWHKVSDKLPPIGTDVLIWVADGFNGCDVGVFSNGKWFTNMCEINYLKITHWAELPEPPNKIKQ